MRLIDADELKELYEDYEGLKVPCEVVLQNIDDMPTAYDIDEKISKLKELIEENVGYLRAIADVVEVVRCKDCKYQGNDDECPLLSLATYTEPDDFCSYGKKVE